MMLRLSVVAEVAVSMKWEFGKLRSIWGILIGGGTTSNNVHHIPIMVQDQKNNASMTLACLGMRANSQYDHVSVDETGAAQQSLQMDTLVSNTQWRDYR